MSEKEKVEKMLKVEDLFADIYSLGIPELKFFDIDSEELLDEKIEVFEALKKGKQIKDIPNFYKVLEKMPENMWD